MHKETGTGEPAGGDAHGESPSLAARLESVENAAAPSEEFAKPTIVPAAALPRPRWEQDEALGEEEDRAGAEEHAEALASSMESDGARPSGRCAALTCSVPT